LLERTVRVNKQGKVVYVTEPQTSRVKVPKYAWRDSIGQWTRCGEGARILYRGDNQSFEFYHDPSMGPCAVYRDAHPLPRIVARRGRTKNLHKLHPYVRRAALELIRRSWAAGVELKIISTYRRHRHKKNWQTKKYRSYSHWHAWGMAVDVNLREYRGLRIAKKNYAKDEKKWLTVARIGQELGLSWAGDGRSKDIFHFEWHPGYGGWIRKHEFLGFLKYAGADGQDYKKMWRIFPHPSLSH